MVKRKRTKAARPKIMSRDGRLCGIHLGGCDQPITGKCELDHIIPLGLAELIAPTPREFDNHWNYQPMHEDCNRKKADTMNGRLLEELERAVTVGGNTPDDWPRFQCKCHYLQIFGEDLFICTKEPAGISEHKLYAGVVKDFEDEDRQDAILVIGQWTGPGGIHQVGYDSTGKSPRGYIFPSISPRRTTGFNIFERSRVGLSTPELIHIDERGHVTPVVLPQGAGQIPAPSPGTWRNHQGPGPTGEQLDSIRKTGEATRPADNPPRGHG